MSDIRLKAAKLTSTLDGIGLDRWTRARQLFRGLLAARVLRLSSRHATRARFIQLQLGKCLERVKRDQRKEQRRVAEQG